MLEVAPAFDTLRYAKQLIGGGFTEQQAETLAEAQAGAIHASLATKDDIARVELAIETLRKETQVAIETLREDTKKDIARVELAIETLRNETKKDIEGLRKDTIANIQAAKISLVKWIGGPLIILGGGLVFSLIRLTLTL